MSWLSNRVITALFVDPSPRINYLQCLDAAGRAGAADGEVSAAEVVQALDRLRHHAQAANIQWTQAQKDALALIVGPQNFANPIALTGGFLQNPRPLAFVHFRRNILGLQIMVRVLNPVRIEQKGHPLCGVVVFMQAIATVNPVGYVRYVLDVATTRKGYVTKDPTASPGQGLYVHVRKHSAILNQPLADDIYEADYIAMASLRNSENILPYRCPFTNQTLEGATGTSDMAKWLRNAGFSDVQDHTHSFDPFWCLSETRIRRNLELASLLLQEGYTVLLVGTQGGRLAKRALGEDDAESLVMKLFAGHAMLLRRLIIRYNGNGSVREVFFDIITWGRDSDQPIAVHVPWAVVKELYRGFVSGKP